MQCKDTFTLGQIQVDTYILCSSAQCSYMGFMNTGSSQTSFTPFLTSNCNYQIEDNSLVIVKNSLDQQVAYFS